MINMSSLRTGPHRIAACVVAGTLLLAGAGANAADSPAPAAANVKTESCLPVNRIRHTKVVDDQTVLFYLAQNKIYKNVLPYKCSLLRSYDAITYTSSNNQLCSVDTISPLDVSAGMRAMKLPGCGIGRFELIDKATADKLISDAKAPAKSSN